ncbi:MAG: DUF2726 domain-containing protein [Pseudomonadota bacterium]
MIEIPLWLVALIGLLLVAGSLAALWLQQKKKPAAPPLPKEWALTARAVFTTGERRVYRMLKETLPNHVILSKLPLVRFCQPIDLGQLRYWYDLLGTNYVSFAICAPNGRVLAAIDIDKDRSSDANPHLRRSMKIKRSVLRSCRVRYLRTPAGKLPSAAEIHALLPKAATAATAAAAAAATQPAASVQAAAAAAMGTTSILESPSAAQSLAAAARAAAAQAAAVHLAVSQVAPQASSSLGSTSRHAAKRPPAAKPTAATAPQADADANANAAAMVAPETAAMDTANGPVADADPAFNPSVSRFEGAQPDGEDTLESSPSATEDSGQPEEALSRAREALAHTVASRRAQRNILWQESSVFQDSFFALDSRLDEFGNEPPSVPGELDVDLDGEEEAVPLSEHASHAGGAPSPSTKARAGRAMPAGPSSASTAAAAAAAAALRNAVEKPAIVKVTLDDMVPSERLSKSDRSATPDVEEARYASSGGS